MKQLRLCQVRQESAYRFSGTASLQELANLLKDYPFDAEIQEKARIHKASESVLLTPFSVTLRIDPESRVEEETAPNEEPSATFIFDGYEVRDGRSKAAALNLLKPQELAGNTVQVHIFVLSKEKMDLL